MPLVCVAANCKNKSSTTKKISVHHFPDDTKYKSLWTKFVQRKRKWVGPSEHSVLCSKHFRKSDYEDYLEYSMGFRKCPTLKKSAIPSVYDSEVEETSDSTSTGRIPTNLSMSDMSLSSRMTNVTATTSSMVKVWDVPAYDLSLKRGDSSASVKLSLHRVSRVRHIVIW